MRTKTAAIATGVALFTLVLTLAVSAGFGGTREPPGPPESTSAYSLEDLYRRLESGAAGEESPFTEPDSGPDTATMVTLDQIMALAPEADNTDGASPAEVLGGRTYWSLRTDGTWGPATGTAPPAPVPRSGQTDCFQVADPWWTCTCGSEGCPAGQDGDLQSGVAWPEPRFTDNGDGTVTDELTGLIWLQNADCAGEMRDWVTALADVAQLNSEGTMNGQDCGDASQGDSHQTDWRLPHVRELAGLLDYGRVNGGVDPALPQNHPFSFPGNPPSLCAWSSTTFEIIDEQAFLVHMDWGGVVNRDKTYSCLVWPVRGGP